MTEIGISPAAVDATISELLLAYDADRHLALCAPINGAINCLRALAARVAELERERDAAIEDKIAAEVSAEDFTALAGRYRAERDALLAERAKMDAMLAALAVVEKNIQVSTDGHIFTIVRGWETDTLHPFATKYWGVARAAIGRHDKRQGEKGNG